MCKGSKTQLQDAYCCRFQVLTDKGTLDAVGLSANAARNRILYRRSIWRLLEPTGLFIVTSCNSTAQELQVWNSHMLMERNVHYSCLRPCRLDLSPCKSGHIYSSTTKGLRQNMSSRFVLS